MSGFRPFQDQSGHSFTGKVNTYAVKSTHATLLAVGDVVTITGESQAGVGSLPYVDATTAGQLITGFIISVDYNLSNLNQAGLPAGTAGTVKVAIGKDMLCVAEIDTAITVNNVGENCDILPTAATLNGGLALSNMKINTAAPAATSAQIRIESLIDGAVAAGSKVVCRINESTTDAVGI